MRGQLVVATRRKLLQDSPVIQIILLLLPSFNVSQEEKPKWMLGDLEFDHVIIKSKYVAIEIYIYKFSQNFIFLITTA